MGGIVAKNQVVDEWRQKFLRDKGLITTPAVTKAKEQAQSASSFYGTVAENLSAHAPVVNNYNVHVHQNRPLPGRSEEMVENRAGGFGFRVDGKTQLDRFLIIGSETPTYYATARELTEQNAQNILKMIQSTDGPYVVRRIVEISEQHRAYRNDPALFALALAASKGNQQTRRDAMFAVNRVARTGGDFLKFISIVDKMRGRGNQFEQMMRHWYQDKSADDLAYQTIKYQKEGSWSHSDVLRLSRHKPSTPEHDALYAYLTKGITTISSEKASNLPDLIRAWEMIKASTDERETLALIDTFKLTWEFVPNEKRTPKVWAALGLQMPMGTTLRYLSNFSRHKLFEDKEWKSKFILRLTDHQFVERSKIHPIRVLIAHAAYQVGHPLDSQRSGDTWPVDRDVVNALELVFMQSLRTPPVSRKRIMVGLDISGSMNQSYIVNDRGQQMPLTAREVAAAMTLSIMSTEPNAILGVFSGAFQGAWRGEWGAQRMYNDNFKPAFSTIQYQSGTRLIDFMRQINTNNFGVTDCAIPMRYAMEKRIPVDVFTIWTDNESYAGNVHPTVALQQYRQTMGIDAKLVVCACTATQYSVADPKDPRQLDVVGFDANVANVINDFIANDW